jgi:hypothetical protein
VLQYAETLYTAGEIAQSYKAYLRVLEMCGLPVEGKKERGARQGPWTRALWGLKLVTAKLLASSSKAIEVERVEEVDAMVTDLLLNTAYKGNSTGVQKSREAARSIF